MSESAFPRSRWSELAAATGGAAAYQQRFDDRAAIGHDVHGEARHLAELIGPPARILDAGCGTGRVAAELTRLGYRCVGVDESADMVGVARERDRATHYVHADLATLFLRSQTFDIVLLAGNVVPLLAPGTLWAAMQRVAAHTQPGGLVVAGFGLDATHLPRGCPITSIEDYDAACVAAGLAPLRRFSTWDRRRWTAVDGYVVTHHRLG